MTVARTSLLARLPAAALAVATIFTLTMWQPNTMRLPYEDALPTIAVVLAIVAALTAVLRVFTASWRRAALIGAIWTAYCFYAPSLVARLAEASWLRWTALALLALFLWDVSRRVPKELAALARVNRLANLVLLPVALIMAGITGFNQVRLEQGRPDPQAVFPTLVGRADAQSPDVWHIIMDRYAGQETLARVYGYDNRPFLDALRQRGFTVSDDAYSNYQRTGHSVTSTLNASYLDPVAKAVRAQNDWVPLYRALTDNAALRFFNEAGYDTIYAGSWWNPTRHSSAAGRNVNFRAIPELGRLILDQSLPGRLMAAFGLPLSDAREDQCRRAKAKFAELRRIAGQPGRKYVFGHFLVPHPPFVLNADGSCRSLAQAEGATRTENYTGQVTYANRELLALVDAILAGPRPATIVLHADEGPWPEPFVGDERFIGRDPVAVDWPRIGQGRLREKMGILLAVRHADGQPADALPTPVNIYPTIINRSFHGAIPLQRERSYVFDSDAALYRFTDVTGILE